MEYVLGIDVGSSSTKAGLFSLDGTAVALASRPNVTFEPLPGYQEEDPEQWWRASVECIRELILAAGSNCIVGIAATGHISSLTFLDAAGVPLRPALGFQDLRAVSEVQEIGREFSRGELADHLGIDLPPSATWPLPRLLWFRKHESETLQRARCLLQAKDFVNYRLTDVLASDGSSNRGIVNLVTGRVPSEVFRRFGLPETLVPHLFDLAEVIGYVCAAAARETGIPEGVPVAAGWNDLNACVLGSGAVECGSMFNVTGTSEHIGVVTTDDLGSPELVCAPFLSGRKLLYGVTSCGGGSMEWYQKAFRRDLAELMKQAEHVAAGCEGLLFLPYLRGERAPIWDPLASGAFIGIRSGHTESHFVRAILEGVSFSLRQILELVQSNMDSNAAPLIVSGGAARVALWNRIRAEVLGHPVLVPENTNAGVLGAAIIAAVVSGYYESCEAAARAMVRFSRRVDPNAETAQPYGNAYRRYCELYPILKHWFASSAGSSKETIPVYAI